MRIRRGRRDRRGKLRAAATLASAAVSAIAVSRELRRPRKERLWHGTVGVVPYDFRAPSAGRIKRSVWDPDNPRIWVPRVFGVGWSLNLAALVSWVRQFRASAAETRPRVAAGSPRRRRLRRGG